MDGKVSLPANVALMLEYEAACSRPDHLEAALFSCADAAIFIAVIAALVEPVETHFIWRPQLRDPSDEMVSEVAVNGAANALVTFNLRDYGDAPRTFGIRLPRPRDALRSLQK